MPTQIQSSSVVDNTNQLTFLIDNLAVIFFIFEVLRLHANKAKNPFFTSKRKKFTTFYLRFAFSENERRIITGKGEQIKLGRT